MPCRATALFLLTLNGPIYRATAHYIPPGELRGWSAVDGETYKQRGSAAAGAGNAGAVP
jgi:hypothetical protein